MYDSSNPEIITRLKHDRSSKSVVLSFDDGPSRVLPQLLDILKKEEVPAVFFWQTRLLYPNRPWKRVLEEGHLIGTHSAKHNNLAAMSYEEQYLDIKNSTAKIKEITGIETAYFRPPFGQFNDDTLKAARELDLKTVMWRIASMDWELQENPETLVPTVVDNLEDGAIILLHELQHTVQVLPDLIRAIRDQGYSFKQLDAEQ